MIDQHRILTWLHIGDFHVRDGDLYDSDTVLKALVESVRYERERNDRKPDLIFVTGDVANSGAASQYERAEKFLADLEHAADVPRHHVFVIPGNHDVDRNKGRRLNRTLASVQESHEFFGSADDVALYLIKQQAFREWHDRYFTGVRKLAKATTCEPLTLVTINDLHVAIAQINSALFCQGDDDHNKLWVGRRSLDPVVQQIQETDADIRIALIHHPLDWLHDAERGNITALLRDNFDVILRGHLHETDVEAVVGVTGNAIHIACGAAYQGSQSPNRVLYVTAHFDEERLTVFPVRYEDAPRPMWMLDTSVFPKTPSYIGSLSMEWKAIPLPLSPPIIANEENADSNLRAKDTTSFVLFKDHVRVDRVSIDDAVQKIENSEAAAIMIQWNAKLVELDTLIDIMLKNIDEYISNVPLVPSANAMSNLSLTKASFYDLLEEMDRVRVDITTQLHYFLKLVKDVDHTNKVNAIAAFCTFGALRLVSYLQQFAGSLCDEEGNVILRIFNDLPRVPPGQWVRCLPYSSTTGQLAFGESQFLCCKIGISEKDYRMLILPAAIAIRYQEKRGIPPDIYFRWVLPQWLHITDEMTPPAPEQCIITTLKGEDGQEKWGIDSVSPWENYPIKPDTAEEPYYVNNQIQPSGSIISVGAIRTVLRLSQKLLNVAKAEKPRDLEDKKNSSQRAIRLFYSYAHADERLQQKLGTHLAGLRADGVIEPWHDRRIPAGINWAEEIDSNLNLADIILFLVSADFQASQYCRGVEVRRAMERHEKGEARVIPVILRDCDWKKEPFGKLMALPTDAKPITLWANRDTAFRIVAQEIRSIAEKLQKIV